jgi:integrase
LRGRPRKPFIKDASGHEILGLRCTPKGRHYAIDPKTGRNVFFPGDLSRAIFEFRRWGRLGNLPAGIEHIPYDTKVDDGEGPPTTIRSDRYRANLNVVDPEELRKFDNEQERLRIAPLVREWILANPQAAAREIGIPELAYLRVPEPSLPLETIGTMYLDRKSKPLDPRWRRDCKRYWDEFCEITGCKTVGDLTAEAVRNYRDTIYRDQRTKKRTPRYVNNRFDAVTTVFGYAPKEAGGQDADNLARASTLLKMLQRLDSDEDNPQPISREHFNKLLDAADTKWKAILLLSLNCAFYPVDVAQVQKAHLDLKNKWLTNNFRTKTRRGKRKSNRIAVLWDRTVEAIAAYWKEEPHESSAAFVSDLGTPYAVKTLQNWFRQELRENTDVPEDVKFNHLRDGAATAAGNDPKVDPLHVDMLLGHKTGVKDRYWHKKPWIVADACAAIERYYFA